MTVWTNALPDLPNAAAARAFLAALRGGARAMRSFRLQHRTLRFIESRDEEKHAGREALWLRQFGKAKLEGYRIEHDCLELVLSTPDEKWHSLAMELENGKVAAIFISEVSVPRAAR